MTTKAHMALPNTRINIIRMKVKPKAKGFTRPWWLGGYNSRQHLWVLFFLSHSWTSKQRRVSNVNNANARIFKRCDLAEWNRQLNRSRHNAKQPKRSTILWRVTSQVTFTTIQKMVKEHHAHSAGILGVDGSRLGFGHVSQCKSIRSKNQGTKRGCF